MSSTILPQDRASFLPANAVGGQVFIDSEFVQWIYNAADKVWERRGVVNSIPLADSITTGYISPHDKDLLDGVPRVPGGFGIIVDTKLLAKTPTNPDGVIQGDIELVSDSLDITCVSNKGTKITGTAEHCGNPPQIEGVTDSPALSFSIKPVFLDTFIGRIPGPKGKLGDKGLKGPKGSTGYGPGPQGDPGISGTDAGTECSLAGVSFVDDDTLTDMALVDLKIVETKDQGCKLIATRAKLNISADRAADRVTATPIVRALVYPPDADASSCDVTRLADWTLIKAGNDVAPTDVQVLRVSKGSNDRDGEAVGFNGTMSLNTLVTDVVTEYQRRLTKLDTQWGKEAKKHIEEIDTKARTILSKLADDLARCEFNLPAVEFGITLSGCN